MLEAVPVPEPVPERGCLPAPAATGRAPAGAERLQEEGRDREGGAGWVEGRGREGRGGGEPSQPERLRRAGGRQRGEREREGRRDLGRGERVWGGEGGAGIWGRARDLLLGRGEEKV